MVIGGGYKILDARTVAFEVDNYNHSLPLVIDPVLNYSAFFGGTGVDSGFAIALDTNDDIYIAGDTLSKQFFTSGAFQTNYGGGTYAGDAFVAKFGNPATNLIYLTYLGGSGDDAAYGLAVNPAGDAYVAGVTVSPNFPVSNAIPGHAQISGGINPIGGYNADAFVTELSASGSNLIYSTYLGGEATDGALAIALDSSSDAYVTGFTYSTNFPATTNALQVHLQCTNNIYYCANAFVSEITNGGGALVYSTYLGGTNLDIGKAIAVDTNNNVYVAGYTGSFNFPVWKTPANFPALSYLNGASNLATAPYYTFDAFVTKFPPLNGTISPASQTNAFYSTFLGGTNNDMAYGIAADSAGNAYVTGWTCSTNFPVTNNPAGLSSFVLTNGIYYPPLATNVFLTKISADGSRVLDSTVFGGSAVDVGYGVAVDPAGDAFVVGSESSINFPTTNTFGSLLATNSSITGANDAFVAGFNANWSTMYYSVCLGGSLDTFGYGIALDSATNVFITGQTGSADYPTQNATRYWFNGTNYTFATNYINGANFTGTTDAFVSEITFAPAVPAAVTLEPTNQIVGMGVTITFSAVVTGVIGQLTYQWQTNGVNLTNGGNFIGANSSTLTITNAQPQNSSTNYGVIISYNAGLSLILSNASLTVSPYPYITTQLTNQTVGVGSTVTFTVTASGAPLIYAWTTNYGNTFLTNNGHFVGVTSNTLTINDAQISDGGVYYVIVEYTNLSPNGDFVSDNANLTVLPAPSFTVPTSGDLSSNGLVLSGVGGTNSGTYFVLASTNLLTPLSLWTPIATNHFGSQGQFIFTNALQTNTPACFYILKQQ